MGNQGLRRRPSPAFVVAMLALLVALGGTATGLPGKNRIDKNDLRKRVVGPLHVKKNTVRSFQLAPNSAGFWHLKPGSVGQSELRTDAVAARAFGYVNTAGNLRTDAPSVGLTNANISNPTPGDFCVNGLPFTPRHVQVTNDSFGDSDNVVSAVVGRNDASCPGNEQVTIETFDISAGVTQDDEFFLMLW